MTHPGHLWAVKSERPDVFLFFSFFFQAEMREVFGFIVCLSLDPCMHLLILLWPIIISAIKFLAIYFGQVLPRQPRPSHAGI